MATTLRDTGFFAVIDNWPIVGNFENGNPIKGRPIVRGRGGMTRAEAEAFAVEMTERGGNPVIVPIADCSKRG